MPVAPGPIETISYLALVVYLTGFLVLTRRASKAAARSVWLFGEGPFVQRLSALLFRVSFVGSIAWPLGRMMLLSTSPSGLGVPAVSESFVLALLGMSMTALGATIALYSQHYMGASWRIGAAEGQLGSMVESGPFAVSRNPVFVGQAMLFAGLLLVFPDVIQGLLTLMLLIAIRLQVQLEEQALSATLGEPYRAYLRRVRRWIGMPPPAALPAAVESSRS